METPSTPQDAAAGPERSPRRANRLPCGHDTYLDRETHERLHGDPKEPTRSPDRQTIDVTFLTPSAEALQAAGIDPDHIEMREIKAPLAAGGFVSGPQPVLVGEKDGPFLSLADHAELARGKTPEHMLDRGIEEAIDTADVHSDDAMLSAVQAQEDVLTPVAEEIRAVLNRYSAEAPSGTPDYILANYLIDCLKAFNEAVSLRSVWRGEPIEQMILHIDKDR